MEAKNASEFRKTARVLMFVVAGCATWFVCAVAMEPTTSPQSHPAVTPALPTAADATSNDAALERDFDPKTAAFADMFMHTPGAAETMYAQSHDAGLPPNPASRLLVGETVRFMTVLGLNESVESMGAVGEFRDHLAAITPHCSKRWLQRVLDYQDNRRLLVSTGFTLAECTKTMSEHSRFTTLEIQ